MKKIFTLSILCLGLVAHSFAQTDSTATPVKATPKQKITKNVFATSKLINMQTTEMGAPGALQFMISHHFSEIAPKGAESQIGAQLAGINSGVAYTYLSFDYTPIRWLNVGVAASGSSKYEGFTKIKIMRQQTGLHNYPVSVALFSLFNVNTAPDKTITFVGDRFNYLNQVLISRKFNDKLSLQVMPSVVHFNKVPYGINNSNDIYSVGLGGKYKMSENVNLDFEYSRQLNGVENVLTSTGNILNYQADLLSVGVEINSGGHQFRFFVGNTTASSNIDQLTRNTKSIADGNFALGFTINRSMFLGK
ncbi:MAG: hypothetical protein RLZ56_1214 [Bacteroidota bacterium]|jgi:hypothetical protein